MINQPNTQMHRFLLLFLCVIAVHHTFAFCIYNTSKHASLFIWQFPLNTGANVFKRFKREDLKPGESACCPYTVYDCVKSGNKEDIVDFAFHAKVNGIQSDSFTLTVPGGGWLNVNGDDRFDLSYEAFNPDGSSFKPQYLKGVHYAFN
ncbi:unnamed protein product [Rhizopus microsporus]